MAHRHMEFHSNGIELHVTRSPLKITIDRQDTDMNTPEIESRFATNVFGHAGHALRNHDVRRTTSPRARPTCSAVRALHGLATIARPGRDWRRVLLISACAVSHDTGATSLNTREPAPLAPGPRNRYACGAARSYRTCASSTTMLRGATRKTGAGTWSSRD